MKTWTKPRTIEIKMDADISSHQDDSYDPVKDGPHFVQNEVAKADRASGNAVRVVPQAIDIA